jgi:holo-[acyl-carrier protein] synthase
MSASDEGDTVPHTLKPKVDAGQCDHAASMESLLGSMLRDIASSERPAGMGRTPKLGVDIVDIAILSRQLTSSIGPDFKLRVFTATEISDCRNQAARFATRWAVKEAVSKAIGTGFRDGLAPSAIQVATARDGSITVAPAAGCRWPHGAEQWCWSVSAAHERNLAVAVVLALP